MAKPQYQPKTASVPAETTISAEETSTPPVTAPEGANTSDQPESTSGGETGSSESTAPEGEQQSSPEEKTEAVEGEQPSTAPSEAQITTATEGVTAPEQQMPQVGDTVTPAPIIEPAPAPVVEPVPAAIEPVQLSESAAARFNTEPTQVSVLKQELQLYVGDLAPGRRIDPVDGGHRQAQIAALILDTVLQPDVQVFLGLMATWCECITANRQGVFNERYAFRFAANVPMAKPKQQQWQHLLTVFLNIADRTPIKQVVDLEQALRSLPDTYASRLRQYAERMSQSN